MRDYANKNRRSSPPQGIGLWVVTIALISLALALPLTMIYMKHKLMLEKKNLSQNNTDKKPVALLKPKDLSQQFDFYTLLPKMSVPNNSPAEKNSPKKLPSSSQNKA